MKLFKVKYRHYNRNYTRAENTEVLSVGKTADEAIGRVQMMATEYDARDFRAEEITEVFGHRIEIKEN